MSAPATPHFNGSAIAHPPAMSRPNGVNGHSPNSGLSLHPSSLSRPPVRADIGRIKQELHDVLGEDGLPYWKALNAYLLGQISRGEMESLVRGWLKGSKGTLQPDSAPLKGGSPNSNAQVQSNCTTSCYCLCCTTHPYRLTPLRRPRPSACARERGSRRTIRTLTRTRRSSSRNLGCCTGLLAS
jgi:hypothetical protein